MIDVRVRNHDRFHFESVPGKNLQYPRNVVTRIDNDSLPGGFVANDGAVAGEKTNRQVS